MVVRSGVGYSGSPDSSVNCFSVACSDEFAVGGVIELQKQLVITNDDITIAGQTAPGRGICLKDNTLRVNANKGTFISAPTHGTMVNNNILLSGIIILITIHRIILH